MAAAMQQAQRSKRVSLDTSNSIALEDRAFHDWYRFVLSYPPHLVRHYINEFACEPGGLVLDPFCGTGTTIVEARKLGYPAIGIDANPVTFTAATAKLRIVPSNYLHIKGKLIIAAANVGINSGKILEFQPEHHDLLITDSLAPAVISKLLHLRAAIEKVVPYADRTHPIFVTALMRCTEAGSNLKFKPGISVVAPAKRKTDFGVVEYFAQLIAKWGEDIRNAPPSQPICTVRYGDARDLSAIADDSISMVITSPPYPCEHDYTRATRAGGVTTGLYTSRAMIKEIKQALLRSNSKGIYKADSEFAAVMGIPSITQLVNRIEAAGKAKALDSGKPLSGFESLYHRVAAEYFGGMAIHFTELAKKLRPGAQCAYVVGDQGSYFGVTIPTAELLLDVLKDNDSYEGMRIEKFRDRNATAATSPQDKIAENVLLFRKKS